jgi:hypothetical protein
MRDVPTPGVSRQLGGMALIGIAAFALVCVSVQFLRSDLRWLDAPLSLYLTGAFGSWVEAVYLLLSIALILVGCSFYTALEPDARSAAPLLLFVASAVALCVTALSETRLPQHAPILASSVHGFAASAAFLCVTSAMLLQSWRLRADPFWRPRFRLAFTLALVCFGLLWTDALLHPQPRGLVQKSLIALILVWLARSSTWLWRGR